MFTFDINRARDSLRRALRVPVSVFRSALRRQLHASHGEAAPAVALGGCSSYLMADVLSKLQSVGRDAALHRQSGVVLARYQRSGHAVLDPAQTHMPRLPPQGLLASGAQA